jgi:hypothetical protein
MARASVALMKQSASENRSPDQTGNHNRPAIAPGFFVPALAENASQLQRPEGSRGW